MKFDKPLNIVLAVGVVYLVLTILTAISPSIALDKVGPTPGLQPMTAQPQRGESVGPLVY